MSVNPFRASGKGATGGVSRRCGRSQARLCTVRGIGNVCPLRHAARRKHAQGDRTRPADSNLLEAAGIRTGDRARTIAILLALTGGLFDSVPLERMRDAELALRKAAEEIPLEVRERFTSSDNLSDSDRKMILQIARESLSQL